MVFVDTGAWYASVVPSDPRHGDTLTWHRGNTLPLLTTDVRRAAGGKVTPHLILPVGHRFVFFMTSW